MWTYSIFCIRIAMYTYRPLHEAHVFNCWLVQMSNQLIGRQICSNCVILSCQYGPKSLRNVSSTLAVYQDWYTHKSKCEKVFLPLLWWMSTRIKVSFPPIYLCWLWYNSITVGGEREDTERIMCSAAWNKVAHLF